VFSPNLTLNPYPCSCVLTQRRKGAETQGVNEVILVLRRFQWNKEETLGALRLVFPIPKGLYHSAQGCEARATLGISQQ
jgi:hypothetical protein